MRFLNLPSDVLSQSLAFLEVDDLIKCLRVSRTFNTCIKRNGPYLWQLDDIVIWVELDPNAYISFESQASIRRLPSFDDEPIDCPSITFGDYKFDVWKSSNGTEITTTFHVIGGCPEEKRYDCIRTLLSRLPSFITFVGWSSNVVDESLLQFAALLPPSVVKFNCDGDLTKKDSNERQAPQIVLEMLKANKHYSDVAFHDFDIHFPAEFFAKPEIQLLKTFKCYRIASILVDDDTLSQAIWSNVDFSESSTPSLSTIGVARLLKEWKMGHRELDFIVIDTLSTGRDDVQLDEETAFILQRVNEVVNDDVEYELERVGNEKCKVGKNKDGIVISC